MSTHAPAGLRGLDPRVRWCGPTESISNQGEERPISRLQHLREPSRQTRKCSGATDGDSPEGPLRQLGKPCLKPAKTKSKRISLERTHRPRPTLRWSPRPTKAAHSKVPSSRLRLARGCTPPSSGLRLARGFTAPSSELRLVQGSLTRTSVPARGYGHLMPRHGRAAPSCAWETCPGPVAPTP
jgi:hypothetical protein